MSQIPDIGAWQLVPDGVTALPLRVECATEADLAALMGPTEPTDADIEALPISPLPLDRRRRPLPRGRANDRRTYELLSRIADPARRACSAGT